MTKFLKKYVSIIKMIFVWYVKFPNEKIPFRQKIWSGIWASKTISFIKLMTLKKDFSQSIF